MIQSSLYQHADHSRNATKYSRALYSSVLILNRNYQPVHIVPVRRAIVLLYRNLGEVIHLENGHYYNYSFESWLEISEYVVADDESRSGFREFIRSVNFQIEIPRVVRLHRYDKVPDRSLRFNRRNLFARDNYQCQFCNQHYPPGQLSFDHVIPRSRGGKTTWENVVCSCLRCNSRKGDRTPEEAKMKLAKRPVKPSQNPVLSIKLDHPKYECWRSFLRSSE